MKNEKEVGGIFSMVSFGVLLFFAVFVFYSIADSVITGKDNFIDRLMNLNYARKNDIENKKEKEIIPIVTSAGEFEPMVQEEEVAESTPAVRSVAGKKSAVSEAEQAEIDAINRRTEQLEKEIREVDEMTKRNKKNNDDYYEAASVPVKITPPPSIKPLPVAEPPKPIVVKPINAEIKTGSIPQDACASSAAKYLPECR